MEGATSGGMELGDFLLFMNNLKICQRAQQRGVATRDPHMSGLVERGTDIAPALSSEATIYTV